MAEFQLDTSGEVRGARLIEQPDGNWRSHWTWADLDAFAQGSAEEVLREANRVDLATRHSPRSRFDRPYGFSDLAPETLAVILKDCARWQATHRIIGGEFAHRDEGRAIWRYRSEGAFPGFPPLTPRLGDDGKVYLRAA